MNTNEHQLLPITAITNICLFSLLSRLSHLSPISLIYPVPHHSQVNEEAVRAGFLNFFVAILKYYRGYLIYGNSSDPDPLVKFRFAEFLAGKISSCYCSVL